MIDFLTLRENVRKRPAMYLGNDNVNGVITGLISESIAATGSSKLSVTVEIQSDNKLSMTFTGSEALHRFGDRILSKTASVDHASLQSLIVFYHRSGGELLSR